jgi:hypothetical protein
MSVNYIIDNNKIITKKCMELLFIKSISKKEFIEICNQLSLIMTENYKEEIKVLPESSTEGGIVIIKNSTNDFLKSLRFSIRCNNTMFLEIDSNKIIFETWSNSQEILFEKNEKIYTYIKYSDNLTKWTMQELDIFINIFNKYNIICSKIPKYL